MAALWQLAYQILWVNLGTGYDLFVLNTYQEIFIKYHYNAVNIDNFILLLYFSLMDSSRFKGSIGKKIKKLAVVDVHGKRLTFWKAIFRNIIPLLFWIILFYFPWLLDIISLYFVLPAPEYLCVALTGILVLIFILPVVYTDKRQYLHDVLSKCMVVNTEKEDCKVSMFNRFTIMAVIPIKNKIVFLNKLPGKTRVIMTNFFYIALFITFINIANIHLSLIRHFCDMWRYYK
jgi:uncharacterized RDD family membrane protein YckC